MLSVLREPSGPTLSLRGLAPEAALRRLELTIVRRLDGYLQGDHLGFLPGPGSDLNDARVYVPGQDDVRRMDWAVTARTTVPHVRDTIADRELEVWALLDATPSMNWGTGGMTKRDLGIAAIATFGFISQKMGDRFGGMIMHNDGVTRLQARSGRNALYGLLRRMLADPIEPDRSGGSVELAAGIEALSRAQQRRGMRIVVSDFLTPGDAEVDPTVPPAWERPLRRLTVRNQVVCVQVLDAAEIDFPDMGSCSSATRRPTSPSSSIPTSPVPARRSMPPPPPNGRGRPRRSDARERAMSCCGPTATGLPTSPGSCSPTAAPRP